MPAISGLQNRAEEALLESRNPEDILWVVQQSASDAASTHFFQTRTNPLEVGFEIIDMQARRLYLPDVFHICFPRDYLQLDSRWNYMDPTWNWNDKTDVGLVHNFGGEAHATCENCGNSLHNMITLDPVPKTTVVTELSRLILATCLSCIGWKVAPLFYHHNSNGEPAPIGAQGDLAVPQFEAEPLRCTQVVLMPSSSR